LPVRRPSKAGLRLHHASEWGIAARPAEWLSAEGLAIYQECEHRLEPAMGFGLTANGLATYRQSKWGRTATMVP
jgi:hypothetical protein